MKQIIFHSFYQDPEMASLKHAILYFDKVVIPKNSFPIKYGEHAKDSRCIQFLPDEMWEQVESLADQGVVELRDFAPKGPDPILFYKVIAEEINAAPKHGLYDRSDFQNILDWGDVRCEDKNSTKFITQVACIIAAFFLKEITQGAGTPFMDNPVIYDALGFGMNGIFSEKKSMVQSPSSHIREMKARILAQRSMALQLPKFELRSFDDVLELKRRLNSELSAFDERILELSDLIASQPWEPGFLAEIDEFVERKIKPDLDDVRRRARSSGNALASYAWKHGRANAGLAFAIYRMWPQMLELVAAGAAATTIVEILKSVREKEEQEISKSGLRFLLKAK